MRKLVIAALVLSATLVNAPAADAVCVWFDENGPHVEFPCHEPIHELELLLDSVVCPVLAVVFPPQGDVPGVWDCPPYGA